MSQIVDDIINEINEVQIHEGHKLMLYEMRPILEKHIAKPQGEWRGRRYYRPSTNQYDCEMSICSKCGEEYSYDAETGISITDYSFCPKCGALMKKGCAV